MKILIAVVLVALLFAIEAQAKWSQVGPKHPRDFTGYERKFFKVHRQPGSDSNYDVETIHETVEESVGKRSKGKKRELVEETYSTQDISNFQQPSSGSSGKRSLRSKPYTSQHSYGNNYSQTPSYPKTTQLGKDLVTSVMGFGAKLLKKAKKQLKKSRKLRSGLKRFLQNPNKYKSYSYSSYNKLGPKKRSFRATPKYVAEPVYPPVQQTQQGTYPQETYYLHREPQSNFNAKRCKKSRKQNKSSYEPNQYENTKYWKPSVKPNFNDYTETNLDVNPDIERSKKSSYGRKRKGGKHNRSQDNYSSSNGSNYANDDSSNYNNEDDSSSSNEESSPQEEYNQESQEPKKKNSSKSKKSKKDEESNSSDLEL